MAPRPKEFILDSELRALRRSGNHNAAQLLETLRKNNTRLQMQVGALNRAADIANEQLKEYKRETDAAFRRVEDEKKKILARMNKAAKLLSATDL